MSKAVVPAQVMNELRSDIQRELHKLTNLIQKRCCFCSKVQDNLFAYEMKGVFQYVCSTCIIKVALTDLQNQYTKRDTKTVYLFKKELESISSYLNILVSNKREN